MQEKLHEEIVQDVGAVGGIECVDNPPVLKQKGITIFAYHDTRNSTANTTRTHLCYQTHSSR